MCARVAGLQLVVIIISMILISTSFRHNLLYILQNRPKKYHRAHIEKANMRIFSLFFLLVAVSGSDEVRISDEKLKNMMNPKDMMQNQHYELTEVNSPCVFISLSSHRSMEN